MKTLLGSFWLMILLPLNALAGWQPQPFNAVYTISMGPLTIGESERTLTRDSAGNYIFKTSAHSTGMASFVVKDQIEERSLWRFTNGAIIPLEYRYKRTGGKREKQQRVVFDWKKGLATNVGPSDPWQIPISGPTYDKLIYQMAASLDLQNGKREMVYHIADNDKIREYQVVVEGEEMVKTPMGSFRAIKIKRINDKRDTVLWCAPSLNYLPIRIDYVELDGSRFKALLKSLSGINVPPGQ